MRTARAARGLNVSGLLMMREQSVPAYQICLAATMSYLCLEVLLAPLG